MFGRVPVTAVYYECLFLHCFVAGLDWDCTFEYSDGDVEKGQGKRSRGVAKSAE